MKMLLRIRKHKRALSLAGSGCAGFITLSLSMISCCHCDSRLWPESGLIVILVGRYAMLAGGGSPSDLGDRCGSSKP